MDLTNAPSGTIRSALRYPDFRRLLSALAVSQIGDWLYNLALVVLVYDRTHSALWAGVTTAARVVPVVVLVPYGWVALAATLFFLVFLRFTEIMNDYGRELAREFGSR